MFVSVPSQKSGQASHSTSAAVSAMSRAASAAHLLFRSGISYCTELGAKMIGRVLTHDQEVPFMLQKSVPATARHEAGHGQGQTMVSYHCY